MIRLRDLVPQRWTSTAEACIIQQLGTRQGELGAMWLSTKAAEQMGVLTDKTHDEALENLERTSQCRTLCAKFNDVVGSLSVRGLGQRGS